MPSKKTPSKGPKKIKTLLHVKVGVRETGWIPGPKDEKKLLKLITQALKALGLQNDVVALLTHYGVELNIIPGHMLEATMRFDPGPFLKQAGKPNRKAMAKLVRSIKQEEGNELSGLDLPVQVGDRIKGASELRREAKKPRAPRTRRAAGRQASARRVRARSPML